MIFEDCRICKIGMVGLSRFLIPRFMKPTPLTRQQDLRVRQIEPLFARICNGCYMDRAREFGILDPCQLPPKGWWCSRGPGHDGPCAAREDL